MGKKLVIDVIVLVLILFLFPSLCFAQGMGSSTGIGLIYTQISSPRAEGMGGAFTAMEGDVNLINYNPAGLANLKDREFSLAYLLGFGELNFANILYGQPTKWGVWGINLAYFNAGNIELNFSDGSVQILNAQSDYVILLSYAKEFFKNLPFGINLKYYSSSILQRNYTSACALDLGILYHTPLDGLNLGFSLQNLGTKIKYYQTEENLPVSIRVGVSYFISEDFPLISNLELDYLLYESKILASVGFEYLYANFLTLRLGYKFIGGAEGLTLGVGYTFVNEQDKPTYGIDYAFGLSTVLVSNHRVSFKVRL